MDEAKRAPRRPLEAEEPRAFVPTPKNDLKKRIQHQVNAFFKRAEAEGRIKRLPTFLESYEDYPELKLLEDGYPLIRDECLRLLGRKNEITDIKLLGGNYTAGGIHTIEWKSFMLHAGGFIEENCRLCPGTAAILRNIPGLYSAFFSILEPDQYIRPHWGYYKGFVRYHLGVIIPRDNADGSCWLRIYDDPVENDTRRKELIENGRKYHWRNGKGVFFDDTWLHDAANESDEVRVVLWLDLARKMPWHLALLNRFCLGVAQLAPSVRRIRKNAVIGAKGAY